MIDVCLLLEGTYPYVAGGVSTWVHQLISAMKDIKFGIVYIAPHSDPTRVIKYDMPQNVIYLKDIFLHDYDLTATSCKKPRESDFDLIENFYSGILKNQYEYFSDFVALFQGETPVFDIPSFFSSKKIWNLLVKFHDQIDENLSFIDFFWTWRSTHLPLLQILRASVPEAKVYHSVSTGYAGLLGALVRSQYLSKYFLTEHGIYTHERMLEIAQSDWIYERKQQGYRAERDLSFFKKFWIKMFSVMSKVSYFYADQIFTLYEGNKLREILEGAKEERIRVIPNGIDLNRFEKIKRIRHKTPSIGLIGRVVAIKDIKTFIQSAKIVLQKLPDAEFFVIGPTNEEEDYYQDCKALVEVLDLTDKIKFTGRANIDDYLSFLDVVVLTSISEAQPYVILEANFCGIPIVATDVGACREMLDGRTEQDKAIGKSGLISEVSNPYDTADKILNILNNPELYESMALAGKERVRKYYDQDSLLSRYLNIYEKNIH